MPFFLLHYATQIGHMLSTSLVTNDTDDFVQKQHMSICVNKLEMLYMIIEKAIYKGLSNFQNP